MNTRLLVSSGLAVVFIGLVLLSVAPVQAIPAPASQAVPAITIPNAPTNILTVTNTTDGDPGSLREAIANATSGDTIQFDLTYPATITLVSQLIISKNLTIEGPGAISLTVSGNSATRVFRVMNTAQVVFQALTIAQGRDISVECDGASCGGGIKIDAGAVVTLTSSVVYSNTAVYGGGIENVGSLVLSDCTFSHNLSNGGTDGHGGGIDNYGTVTISNSTFANNLIAGAFVVGGGIWNATAGTVTMTNSTLSNNQATDGGGIANEGHLSIDSSTFSGNSAFDGGGIFNFYGTVTVNNSTLSGNSAASSGGGIWNISGTLTINNSTFAGNSGHASDGGGLNNGGTLIMRNTLLGNSPSGGDCVNYGTISVNVHNLAGDSSCNPMRVGPALLGPLADNGGNTWTHALLIGSPARDAGDDASCLAVDQRGVARPRGPACDIGAFEAPPQERCLLPLILK